MTDVKKLDPRVQMGRIFSRGFNYVLLLFKEEASEVTMCGVRDDVARQLKESKDLKEILIIFGGGDSLSIVSKIEYIRTLGAAKNSGKFLQ